MYLGILSGLNPQWIITNYRRKHDFCGQYPPSASGDVGGGGGVYDHT